jgi:hypothetical protein
MTNDSTNEKKKAHALIEMLPSAQLAAVVGLLEAILDPVARAIASAPFDDEPVTLEEAKALEEARDWAKNNPGIPHAQLLAELGVSENEVTDETAAEIEQSRESLARGEGIPHEEILREFGLKK